jgi:peptidylprolyl isomerase
MPVVGGTFAKSATLTVKGKPGSEFVVHTVTEGTGATVGADDYAVADVLVKDWTSGKTVSDSYANKSPLVSKPSTMIASLKEALQGHKVGSRVVVIAPPATAAAQLSSGSTLGIKATDTLAMVVDITATVPSDGQVTGAQAAVPAGLPAVESPAKQPAKITIPKGAKAPTDLKTVVLVKGNGPKVEAGQTIVAQYTGVTWADGKTFDSSWKHSGAFSTPIGTGQVISGWDKGLVGQTVGSRVELVIPPSLGYKDQAQQGIPANSTLVFVIDILAAA